MSILSKFTVLDLVKTRSASVLNITGNVLKFNTATAVELHYPSHIQILMNPKDKQVAIRACKEDAPNAIPFSKPAALQKAPIKFSLPVAVDMIRKWGEWMPEENWNIPGIYFAEDNALVYDVKTAVPPAERHGGWDVKRQKEAEAAAAAAANAETEI